MTIMIVNKSLKKAYSMLPVVNTATNVYKAMQVTMNGVWKSPTSQCESMWEISIEVYVAKFLVRRSRKQFIVTLETWKVADCWHYLLLAVWISAYLERRSVHLE